jgi:hypothetical protein
VSFRSRKEPQRNGVDLDAFADHLAAARARARGIDRTRSPESAACAP